jgi:hypothetical protein
MATRRTKSAEPPEKSAKRLDVVFHGRLPSPKKARLYVDVDLAKVVRKLARAERLETSGFLEMLVRYWLRSERPQWDLVEEGTSDLADDFRSREGASGSLKKR